jgi:hypothetical protein
MARLMFLGIAFLLIGLAPSSSTLAKDGFGNGGGYHRGGGDHHGGGLHRAGPAIVVVGGGDGSRSNNACAEYPGYDPASATYLGPDGSRYPCQ